MYVFSEARMREQICGTKEVLQAGKCKSVKLERLDETVWLEEMLFRATCTE